MRSTDLEGRTAITHGLIQGYIGSDQLVEGCAGVSGCS
jgi:hypothetical protein